MTRAGGRRALILLLILLASLLPAASSEGRKARPRRTPTPKPTPVNFDSKLPVLGTRLSEFPPGNGKALADQACLACHSADMIWQQRLTDKQWTANVTKMVGWGAPVPDDQKAGLVEYLVKNFGPDNDRFQPVITRPVGK